MLNFTLWFCFVLFCRVECHQKKCENKSNASSLNSRLLTWAGIMCRILFSASSSGNTRCHSNWSLNYTSKVSARGRLIHHSGEARRFELAAVSAAALKAREACLKLRSKAGLAAKLSVTPRSVTRVHVQGLFELYCWQANQAINKQCPTLELLSWNIRVKPHPEDINCRCGPTKNTSCTSQICFPKHGHDGQVWQGTLTSPGQDGSTLSGYSRDTPTIFTYVSHLVCKPVMFPLTSAAMQHMSYQAQAPGVSAYFLPPRPAVLCHLSDQYHKDAFVATKAGLSKENVILCQVLLCLNIIRRSIWNHAKWSFKPIKQTLGL